MGFNSGFKGLNSVDYIQICLKSKRRIV